MSKLSLTYFLLFFFIFSCNQNDIKEKKQTVNLVEEPVEDTFSTLLKVQPTINKDQENDVWNGNVYRNLYYKFRVEFPKGWEYDKGSSKSTVARAGNREIGATFSVVVKHLGSSISNSGDITKDVPLTRFKEEMLKRLDLQKMKVKNFKIQKGYLNNFSAYLVEFNQLVKSGDREFNYLSKQVQCHMGNNIYVVGLNIPEESYGDEMNIMYHRVIDSFKFEIAY